MLHLQKKIFSAAKLGNRQISNIYCYISWSMSHLLEIDSHSCG